MSEHGAEKDAPYAVAREDGYIIAACICGKGIDVTDKGLGRATVAAWKTQHRACKPRPIPPAQPEASE